MRKGSITVRVKTEPVLELKKKVKDKFGSDIGGEVKLGPVCRPIKAKFYAGREVEKEYEEKEPKE